MIYVGIGVYTALVLLVGLSAERVLGLQRRPRAESGTERLRRTMGEDWVKLIDHGGPFHPVPGWHSGASLRDCFAMHAPIDYDMVVLAYGGQPVLNDTGRATFLAVWTMLRYEWADAMLAERQGKGMLE